MNALVRGGIAGLLATATMSCTMWLGTKAGLLHTPPPKKITKRAAQKAGVHPHLLPPETFTVSWMASHAAFGALTGVIFAAVRPLMPRSAVTGGLLYGAIVWAVNYLGIMPALGLFSLPDKHPRSQDAVMLAAHGVYGITLAELDRM